MTEPILSSRASDVDEHILLERLSSTASMLQTLSLLLSLERTLKQEHATQEIRSAA